MGATNVGLRPDKLTEAVVYLLNRSRSDPNFGES